MRQRNVNESMVALELVEWYNVRSTAFRFTACGFISVPGLQCTYSNYCILSCDDA